MKRSIRVIQFLALLLILHVLARQATVCLALGPGEDFATTRTQDLRLSDLIPQRKGSSRIVERIVAWVDEEPVALSEVEQALMRYQSDGLISQGPTTEGGLRRALERWIDEMLILAAAKKAGIKVPAETIDNRVDATLGRIEKRQGGREKLEQMLVRVGKDREKLREMLRAQVRREWTIARALGSRISITDAEVAEFEKERQALGRPAERYHLSHFFLPVATGSSQEQWDKAIEEAHQLRLAAERAGDFTETARAWAKLHARRKAVGGRLGSVEPGELQPELARQLPALEVGRSGKPVRTSRGVHVLYLERKVTARQILFAQRFEEEQSRWVAELRRAAAIQIAESLLE